MFSPRGLDRQRSAFLDACQTEFETVISLPEVQTAIGEETATQLSTVNAGLFLPNLKRDKVTLPRAYRETDNIPFVPVADGGHRVFADSSILAPTPRQFRYAAERIMSIVTLAPPDPESYVRKAASGMAHAINNSSESREGLALGQTGSAMVKVYERPFKINSAITRSGTAERFYLAARPIMLMKMDQDYRVILLAHELTHVEQLLRNPVSSADPDDAHIEKIRKELEAHHVQVKVGETLYDSTLAVYSQDAALLRHRATVEAIRQSHARPDQPFEPTLDMMKEMARLGIGWASVDFMAAVRAKETN